MSNIYLTHQIAAHIHTGYDGRVQTTLARTGDALPTTGYTTSLSLASANDVQYHLQQLKTEVEGLKSQVSMLMSELIRSQKKPLSQEQVQVVMDQAYKDQSAQEGNGEQATIWDGIESHVIRATERAHGIQ